MKTEVLGFLPALTVSLLLSSNLAAGQSEYCCQKALELGKNGTSNWKAVFPDMDKWNATCGQKYLGEHTSPSGRIMVQAQWCVENCPGWERTKFSQIDEWAYPLIGFLVPAAVFSMVVPRSDYIRIPIPKDTCRMILFAFPIAVLDLLLWVVVVFILAGPLLVGGIYESIVDRRLLKLLDDGATNNQARKMLLVVILLGNIAYREGDVLKDVEDFIFRAPGTQAKMNLKSLLDCQAAFGVTIGGPAIFYTGALLYAIVDTASRGGDNSTSHAVAYGLWYGIFVYVAVICGNLLGANNPATLLAVASRRFRSKEDTVNYRPRSMWNRGASINEWASFYGIRLEIKTRTWLLMGGTSLFLIFIPCSLAFFTSFYTPEIGLSCRSGLTMVYFLSQVVLTSCAVAINFLAARRLRFRKTRKKKILRSESKGDMFKAVRRRFKESSVLEKLTYVCAVIATIVAFLTGIIGTALHLAGFTKNCWCQANLRHWNIINKTISEDSWLQFATDTEEQRDTVRVWYIAGFTGVFFLVSIATTGWLYQMYMRNRVSFHIDKITSSEDEDNPPDTFRLRLVKDTEFNIPLYVSQYSSRWDIHSNPNPSWPSTSRSFVIADSEPQKGNIQLKGGNLVLKVKTGIRRSDYMLYAAILRCKTMSTPGSSTTSIPNSQHSTDSQSGLLGVTNASELGGRLLAVQIPSPANHNTLYELHWEVSSKSNVKTNLNQIGVFSFKDKSNRLQFVFRETQGTGIQRSRCSESFLIDRKGKLYVNHNSDGIRPNADYTDCCLVREVGGMDKE